MALGSVALVAGSGALAVAVRGPARAPSGPVLPRPPAIADSRVFALAGVAFAGALAVVLIALQHARAPGWLLIVVAGLLIVAGAVAGWTARAALEDSPGPAGTADSPVTQKTAGRVRPAWRAAALTVTLGLIAVRSYAGPIRLDWPYIRGTDQFSYVIMSEQMMRHGSYATFLTYPPGFSTLFAVVCRLSGLTPLTLYPVLTPALLLLTSLAAYVLATRLWGWGCGIAALALSGLVLDGAYAGFGEGRYPDLLSAFFLMVMLVAALMVLYQAPSLRSAALVTVVGASVVFYHPAVSLYLVLLLALVALGGLPYLLLRGRRHDAGVLAGHAGGGGRCCRRATRPTSTTWAESSSGRRSSVRGGRGCGHPAGSPGRPSADRGRASGARASAGVARAFRSCRAGRGPGQVLPRPAAGAGRRDGAGLVRPDVCGQPDLAGRVSRPVRARPRAPRCL